MKIRYFIPVLSLLVCTGVVQANKSFFSASRVISQNTIEVGSISELIHAVNNSNPGDLILIEDGNYSGSNIILKAKGTKGNPIAIKAKNPGKVFFESRIEIEGDYIQIDGINFIENGNLEIFGTGCRVTNCIWNDSKSGKWLRVLPGSSRIEIDHNTFQNKVFSNQNMERNCQLVQIVVRNQNERHHIHHNLFKDVAKGKTGNGFETLQLITENNPFDPPAGDCNSLIEDNLFIRCNGESEIISVKSNGNILKRNTFRACRGGLVLRHGDNNAVTQNYLFGDGEAGSAGVRIQGTGQIVANNYFEELGAYGLGMMDGTPDDLYIRVEQAQILFNTFINCNNNFTIGINHSKHPNGTVPKDCKIIGNIFYSEKGNQIEEFIVFVQNDQPVNWEWKDNIGFGRKCPETSGFMIKNPEIKRNELNLIIPTLSTISSEVSDEFNEILESDLFGNIRNNTVTVGAIQFPVSSVKNKPLNESLVGAVRTK